MIFDKNNLTSTISVLFLRRIEEAHRDICAKLIDLKSDIERKRISFVDVILNLEDAEKIYNELKNIFTEEHITEFDNIRESLNSAMLKNSANAEIELSGLIDAKNKLTEFLAKKGV